MEMDFSDESIKKAKNEFKSHSKGDGKRGPFYKNSEWIFNKENGLLFENAVWQGYLDASRTFHNVDTVNRRAFNNLAGKIQNFFSEKEKFNHEGWCDGFIKDVKNYNNYECRYGQAQKVVNMAFKYLYCCDGIDISKFAECHMPLDQYTLAWYFAESGKYYLNWSYFDNTNYVNVQNDIKVILKEKGQADILAAELVIWNNIKDGFVDLKKQWSVAR